MIMSHLGLALMTSAGERCRSAVSARESEIAREKEGEGERETE